MFYFIMITRDCLLLQTGAELGGAKGGHFPP